MQDDAIAYFERHRAAIHGAIEEAVAKAVESRAADPVACIRQSLGKDDTDADTALPPERMEPRPSLDVTVDVSS